MTNIDLKKKQTLKYFDFLMALPDEEYMPCVDTTEEGCTLHSGVVQYAKIHYPHITIA